MEKGFKFHLLCNYVSDEDIDEIQVRQFVATIIFLKGVGGVLFVFGSSFGSFLLVRV